jgi:hypothetical protein
MPSYALLLLIKTTKNLKILRYIKLININYDFNINPLPPPFKALLHGQKDRVFSSRHLIYILKQERFRAFRPAGDI